MKDQMLIDKYNELGKAHIETVNQLLKKDELIKERDELIRELCKHVFKIRLYCSDHWGVEICNVYEKAKKIVGEK